jgi:hypothetical protein
MWIKLVIIFSVSFLLIFYGVLWFGKSLSSKVRYDFKEDIKYSFITPHWSYSGFFNFDANRPRRIVPVMLVLGGVGILVVGLFKII